MAREWIEPIYDRTYGNISSVQNNPDQINPKGCWNAVDLNRIENNTAYCVKWMYEKKIIRFMPDIEIKEEGYWVGNMIPTQDQISRIINNVRLLITYSMQNPAIASRLPTIYSATQINYVLANQIEFALDLMHDQPKLPLDYWTLKINNGIVTKIVRDGGLEEYPNSNEVLVAEDEIVTIHGVEYGEYAQYQNFTTWSGQAEDLGLLDPSSESQTVTFIYPYRNVELTANFETHIPRTLTLTNAYISVSGNPTASSGPSTKTYFAGDRVMIIANVAPIQKKFYEWQGTSAALSNISGATSNEDPSTAWLIMPDEDVSLEPKYIYAGNHTVTVYNGTLSGGATSGSFAYGETVYISATIPDHYAFVSWTGDYVSYLTNPTSSFQSFKMKDENVWFRATNAYQYSTNSVQVIDGYIRINGSDVTRGSVTESNSYTLTPNLPDSSYGLYNWSIEGAGSITGSTFTAGDGNSIITANLRKYRTLTATNINNNPSLISTSRVLQGSVWTVSTNWFANSNYRFNGWYENNVKLSDAVILHLTSGDSDRTVEARYDYYPTYVITVLNRNNENGTHTYNVVSGNSFEIDTDEDTETALFLNWSGDKSSSSSTISWTVTSDATITANYRSKEYYDLTVVNGTGSGRYLEKTLVSIVANSPQEGYYFSGWSHTGISRIINSVSSSTLVEIGRQNGTVTANYAAYEYYNLTVNNGTGSGRYVKGSSVTITANSPQEGYRFVNWSYTGVQSIDSSTSSSTTVRIGSQDATVTANYREIEYYDLTVVNGSGSGRYAEYSWVNITANTPSEGSYFLNWYHSGLQSINNASSSSTSVQLGRQNATVTANYTSTRTIQVIRNNGTLTYTVQQDSYTPYFDYGTPPSEKRFKEWQLTSGDATIGNIASGSTRAKANYQDSVITAIYENIPKYTVTMIDGEIQNTSGEWVNSAALLPGSTNIIRVKQGSVPLGYQFLIWEVYVNGILQTTANDVLLPYAETTSLRSLSRDITIKATFYTPNPDLKYKLKIYRIDGSVNISEYAVGDSPGITASTPPQGKEFFEWTGDVSYLGDNQGNAVNWVRMPAQDVELTETYVDEGYIPKYHLYMTGVYGECCYTTEQEDPETGEIETIDHWVTDYEYPKNTEVRIRTRDIEDEYYFVSWNGKVHNSSEETNDVIKDRTAEESVVVIPAYHVDVEPSVLPKQTYLLKINNGYTGGRTSAYYYEGKKADIYFGLVDTEDVHYIFTRWTGEKITKLNLWDGGLFDPTTPGDVDHPQYVKMPGESVEITGNYRTLFRLTVNNGTIDSTSQTKGYYEANTNVTITADSPAQGMVFRYWTGDTGVLSSIYDPTPTITTVTGTTTLTAFYSEADNTNNIGYVETSLKTSNTVNNNDIHIIAGEIEPSLLNDYIVLDYIESTGTQYIDTGVIPNQYQKYCIDFQILGDIQNERTSTFGAWGRNI